jgi:hypothetical protein
MELMPEAVAAPTMEKVVVEPFQTRRKNRCSTRRQKFCSISVDKRYCSKFLMGMGDKSNPLYLPDRDFKSTLSFLRKNNEKQENLFQIIFNKF